VEECGIGGLTGSSSLKSAGRMDDRYLLEDFELTVDLRRGESREESPGHGVAGNVDTSNVIMLT
jgi:hypothetical protein